MSEAISESGIPPLYASVAIGGDDVYVVRSVDRGVTWAPMFTPSIGGAGTNPGGSGLTRGHFTLAADPTDANIVYAGGDRQPYPYAPSGTTDYSGNLFIGDWRKSDQFWQPIVGSFAGGTAPHADSRYMTFDSAGNLIQSDDGGVYRLRFPKDPMLRRWESMNGNLRTAEFYSVAWDAHNDVIFGGTQDVGSVEQIAFRSRQWRDARIISMGGQDIMTAEGDGGSVAVDNHINPNASVRYIMINNYFRFHRRDYPAASPATNWGWILFNDPSNFLCTQTGLPFCGLADTDRPSSLTITDIVTFIQQELGAFRIYPIAVNQVEPYRLAVGLNTVYESPDQGITWRPAMVTPVRATALSYGGVEANGTPNPEALVVAYGENLRTRATIGTVSDRHVATSAIRDIVVDPSNWRSVYFLQSNRVFRIDDITNPGSAPIDLTGNLTNTLVSFRTIELYHEASEIVLIVGGMPVNQTVMGTDSGGVATLRNANTVVPPPAGPALSWARLGNGLPNIIVTDLQYDPDDDVLVAGTWGRGAWTIETASDLLR